MYKNFSKTKGISLLEIIIGISIIFISVVSVISTYNFFFRMAQKNVKIVKAEYLLEEGIEIVRSMRDFGWQEFSDMPTNVDNFLFFNGTKWELSNNVLIDNFFERKFIMTDVYRDGGDNISLLGTLDSGSKKVEVFVSWNEFGATTTISNSVILTNLFE